MIECRNLTYIYEAVEFEKILKDFSKAYHSKKYSDKIPYYDWKKLTDNNDLDIIEIEYTHPFIDISRETGVEVKLLYTTNINDNGFGSFFFDEFIQYDAYPDIYSKRKDETIAMTNNTYVNSLSTTSSTSGVNYIDQDYYCYDNYNDASTASVCNAYSNRDIINKLDELLEKKNLEEDKKEENKDMMNGIKFDFGPCGNNIRLSMYGLAIQNSAGEWVSYNAKTKEIMNVDVFNIPEGGKYMYKMPVAIKDVKSGDIVIHNNVPMIVIGNENNGSFSVVDVKAGESKVIIPSRNMFGFNFMTKVVNLFSAVSEEPSADQPFGNMLPFLMMGNENGKFVDTEAMLMFMMMQGQNGFTNVCDNPMMLYFLMKDNKDINPMIFMMMMNQQKTPTISGWIMPEITPDLPADVVKLEFKND